MPSKRNLCLGLFAVLCSAVLCWACGTEPEGEQTEGSEVCSGDELTNVVDASDWATERAGIERYRYVANVPEGVARVELLDADRGLLDTMAVRQIYGAESTPDGTMEAVLGKASDDPLRLRTRGLEVSDRGYTVEMRLKRPGDPKTLEIRARFETVRCWEQGDSGGGPPCASGLALEEEGFTLPTCGLLLEERLRERRPPALERLSYAVLADQAASVPTVGGSRREGTTLLHRLQVREPDGLRDPETVRTWLQETGTDELVGTDRERLLTTAFLDRVWWRTLFRHVAHCDLQRLPRPPGTTGDTDESELRTETLSLCPGDHDSGSWGSGDDSSGGSVWGEPHIETFDGHSYDLQAAGEFVLFRAVEGEPLEVQGRFEPLENPEVPGCEDLSRNTAAATEVAGVRVTARIKPQWEVRIDGELVEDPSAVPELDDGAFVELGNRRVTVGWPGGETAEFSATGDDGTGSVTVRSDMPPSRRGQIRGIFGSFDGSTSNDLVLPDGTVLEQPASYETLYGKLAPAWEVRSESSLFDYPDGGSPSKFRDPTYPGEIVGVTDLPDDRVAEAESTCRERDVTDPHLLETCIIDVVCLDDSQAQASADTEPPLSSQAPGRTDLVTHGAIRRISPPETVAAEAPSDERTCEPPGPAIALFEERTRIEVGGDLEVGLGQPGAYGTDDNPDATIIDAGTAVASYQIVQSAPESADFPYYGRVRFARPIVGVLVDGSSVASTDGEYGYGETDYEATEFEGLRSDFDTLTIGPNRRTLEVLWRGEGSRRVRVLTEAPEP